MEITTTEINRQANRLRVQLDRYKGSQSATMECLNYIKDRVKSANGSLYNSINNYISTYESLSNKLVPQIEELANRMKQYVADTLENNANAEKRITELKDELSRYIIALASI